MYLHSTSKYIKKGYLAAISFRKVGMSDEEGQAGFSLHPSAFLCVSLSIVMYGFCYFNNV